jgi:O-antigen/teichoic acid export membrane protein
LIAKVKELIGTNKFLSLLSSGVSAGLGLLTFTLLVRVLTKEEFGFWGFFITVFTLFEMLRTGLLSSAMIKGISESDEESKAAEIIGSGWKLSMRITLWGTGIVSPIFLAIYYFTSDTSYLLIAQWFGIMAFSTIPHTLATWVLNAYLRFGKIVWIRLALQGGFLIGAILEYYLDLGLWFIFLVYFLANVLTATVVFIYNWAKTNYYNRGTKEMNKSLISFGKYSMGTLIGSNLLRSSDTFIIFSFLGPAANAVYMVPERLIGLIDIPLQALVSLAFPTLAKKNKHEDRAAFQREFDLGAGFSSILLLPISILTFVFAEPLVVLLGGEGYADAANILRIFAVYTALTPLDRFSGIALDVLHRPQLNFYKVLAMLSANVIGDLIVVHYTDNIAWVAFVSIITFATGIVFGFVFLRDVIPFKPLRIIRTGGSEVFRLVKKYVGK